MSRISLKPPTVRDVVNERFKAIVAPKLGNAVIQAYVDLTSPQFLNFLKQIATIFSVTILHAEARRWTSLADITATIEAKTAGAT